MSLIKVEYYIVKQAEGGNSEGGKLAGYQNKVYDDYQKALVRAETVCKASGKEMLVFQAISRIKPVLTTTTSLERIG